MAQYQIPLVDERNPLYCPSVSPNSYLAALHQSLSKSNVSKGNVFLYSFARILDQNFFDVDQEYCSKKEYNDQRFVTVDTHPRNVSRSTLLLPAYSPPSWERHHLPVYPPGLVVPKHKRLNSVIPLGPASSSSGALKRKRPSISSNTFSGLEGPTKRGRSSESVQESSFDLTGHAERLFGSSLHKESSAVGSKYAGVPLPEEANTGQDQNDNEPLTRILTLEGMF